MNDNFTSNNQLHLSDGDIANLREGAKWSRFMSIVSLVMLGLILTAFVAFGGTMMTLATMQGGAAAAAGVTTIFVIYGIVFFIGIYLAWMKYKFSSRTIDAITTTDQSALTEGLTAFRKMHKVTGIITAIYLGFAALGIGISLIGGAAAFFSM